MLLKAQFYERSSTLPQGSSWAKDTRPDSHGKLGLLTTDSFASSRSKDNLVSPLPAWSLLSVLQVSSLFSATPSLSGSLSPGFLHLTSPHRLGDYSGKRFPAATSSAGELGARSSFLTQNSHFARFPLGSPAGASLTGGVCPCPDQGSSHPSPEAPGRPGSAVPPDSRPGDTAAPHAGILMLQEPRDWAWRPVATTSRLARPVPLPEEPLWPAGGASVRNSAHGKGH